MEKICWQITVAAFMQQLANKITAHPGLAHLDLPVPPCCEQCSPNTFQWRDHAWTSPWLVLSCNFRFCECAAEPSDPRTKEQQALQDDFRDPDAKDNSITNAATARSNLDATITMRSAETELQTAIPFTLRERSYSCKAEWNSIGNSSTSNTCNPIYIAGTILQLQITMEFHRQLIHQHHLQPHLQCGNDPTVANHNGILSTAHARKTVETPFTMRNRSEHDPNMIRPHTRPSRNRRTAEVDHRGSETDFVWKNIGFRASAISQKRISCETSFKTPSATPPPAPLAMPF